ncbi:MAG: HEAT repeat domain-containing protein [Deltaproteobacteria bacterium]|nr:HEAT repeat domain-containing protein [Deltaproteobacteria bacterium]
MNQDIQPRVAEAIVIINKATKNLRLYPPSSAIVVNTIDKLQEVFLDIFAQETSLDFAEAEKQLLVGGEALPPKEQVLLQVVSFVDLLINFSLKSITFQKGMSREELIAFLGLIVQPPVSGNQGDALQAALAEKQVTHIILNQKVYIAKDQDNQLLASLDIKDDEIVKYMAEAYPDEDFDIEKIRGMVQDDAWVSNIFQSGMKQIMKDQGVVSSNLLTQSMMRLFAVLDKVTSLLDQEKICRLIAKSIADLDPEMISQILSQDMDRIFGGGLFQQVIDQLSDEKIEQVALQMQVTDQEHSLVGSADRQSRDDAYQRLLTTEKGGEMQRKVAARQLAELTEQEREKIILHEQVQQIIKGSDDQFLQSEWMTSLPGIVTRILDVGEQRLADDLVERIVRGLASDAQNVRNEAAIALVEVTAPFTAEGQLAHIERNSGALVEWIRREMTASLAYRKICSWLKDLSQDLILRGSFTEAIPILEVFNRIHYGLLDKNDTINTIAGDIIRELASGELLTILFDEFENNRQNKQFEAGLVLVRLEEIPLNRLLDILRENEDSNKRVRILQVIADIGLMAVPVIRERLQGDEPWYYVRNLAYLMGKVGAETTADVLQPLLLHKNGRVREEALKSLHRTGGNNRGPLMMSALPTADDEFKLNIIESLGSIKYVEAVPALLDILKERPLVASVHRIELEEKICTVLGKIGSGNALPVLKEISQPKFFFLNKYPGNVRKAATRALVAIEARADDEARKVRR